MVKINVPGLIAATTISGKSIVNEKGEPVVIQTKDIFGSIAEQQEFHGVLKGVMAVDLSARTGKWLRELPEKGGEMDIDQDILDAFIRGFKVFQPNPQIAHCLQPIVDALFKASDSGL